MQVGVRRFVLRHRGESSDRHTMVLIGNISVDFLHLSEDRFGLILQGSFLYSWGAVEFEIPKILLLRYNTEIFCYCYFNYLVFNRENSLTYLRIQGSARPRATNHSPAIAELRSAQAAIAGLRSEDHSSLEAVLPYGSWADAFRKLTKVNRIACAAIRQWLVLFNDTPTRYFHARLEKRGLRISSVCWLEFLHRRNRLLGLVPEHEVNHHRRLPG